MSNNSPISRRGLLRLGIIGGMLAAVGCGEPAVQTIDNAPSEGGGNRNRLEGLQEKTELLESTPQKKRR